MADLFDPEYNGASESECRTFRWWLRRGHQPFAAFLMVNPSHADAYRNDMTVLRCGQWTRRWGYCGHMIVNAVPYRSPSPAACREWWFDNYRRDPSRMIDVLKWNEEVIKQIARTAAVRIVAFGANYWANEYIATALRAFSMPSEVGGDNTLYCLGTNIYGWPLHPMARGKMRIAEDIVPQPWTNPGITA